MSLSISADNSLLVSRSDAREAVGKSLRLYVGRGRRYSVKQLSNATGVPDRTIECAICDPEGTDFRPLPIECLLSISLFLGAEFSSEWMRLARQGAFDLPEEDMPPPGAIAAEDAADTAEIVGRAVDGEFCAEDRKALRVVGQREIRRGMTLVALSSRKAAA
jgi:hypothetical protein